MSSKGGIMSGAGTIKEERGDSMGKKQQPGMASTAMQRLEEEANKLLE